MEMSSHKFYDLSSSGGGRNAEVASGGARKASRMMKGFEWRRRRMTDADRSETKVG